MCFSVKFAKYLRTSILKNICERLLMRNIGLNKWIYLKRYKMLTSYISLIYLEWIKTWLTLT